MPRRRQTLTLVIDPDQILRAGDDVVLDGTDIALAVADNTEHDTVMTRLLDHDRDLRQCRPPALPSRRSTVRLTVDPEQMIAFEAWRIAQLGNDDNYDEPSDCEEDNDYEGDASSRMDWTMDTTIVSCFERLSEVDDDCFLSDHSKSLLSCSNTSPPNQPKRRSTFIVTLSESSNGNVTIDFDEQEKAPETAPVDRRPILGEPSQGNLFDESFSESSIETSVFVEIFCRQLAQAQRQETPLLESAARAGTSGGRHGSTSRQRRSRASLKVRVPKNHLKTFMRMPQLGRIESVGTVADEDDAPATADATYGLQTTCVSDTPENSVRPPPLIDWTDATADAKSDVVPTMNKAGVDQRPVKPCRRATVRVIQHFNNDEISPGNPTNDIADKDEAKICTGREHRNGSPEVTKDGVGSFDKEKELRTSIGTVATEASWDTEEDENDDASVVSSDQVLKTSTTTPPVLQYRRANSAQLFPHSVSVPRYGAPSSSLLIDEDE
jgi:hypothetical protein